MNKSVNVNEKRRTIVINSLIALVLIGVFGALVSFIVLEGKPESSSELNSNEVPNYSSEDGSLTFGNETAEVTLDVYEDIMCPGCAYFMIQNDADIQSLLESDELLVKWHPMTFLDEKSQGTAYSTRATNAIATVADLENELAYPFIVELYKNQPKENTPGLSDEEIANIAISIGVSEETASKFTDNIFYTWVDMANTASNNAGIYSTPSVFINGVEFTGDWTTEGTLLAALKNPGVVAE